MSICEVDALNIMHALIQKPGVLAEDIPRIWKELIDMHNAAFTPVVEVVKKKRRKTGNPNIGWPAGVKRAEYKTWKEEQQARGVTENLNPQEYKRQRSLGVT